MGIVHENTNFHGSETNFAQEKKLSSGKKIGGNKEKEAPVLAPHGIPMRIQSAFTRGCRLFQLL